MTDEEKIEAAIATDQSRLEQDQALFLVDAKKCFGADGFDRLSERQEAHRMGALIGWRHAIKWRDKNPSPHVMALVEIVRRNAEESGGDCYCEPEKRLTCTGCHDSAALANFEKAVKGE